MNQLSTSPVGYTYHYDQLNRLKKMRQHTGISGTSWTKSSITPNYQENVTYDANGNILTYGRNGAAPTAQTIDSLTYNYARDANGRLTSNKLQSINDAIATSNYANDLTNQTNPTNYRYDAIGNLIYDAQSLITGNDGVNAITWSVYGKILNIYKTTGTISYTYNPAGQRVSKTVAGLTTWYIRDAQGNTLAVYDNKASAVNWREQHLYGSSRLGLWTPNVNLATNNALAVWDTVGRKQFELDNHLGNVLETITDKHLQHTTNGTTVDYYLADIATAQDYYPFGMLMPNRQYTFTANGTYRYGFNGKENDNEVKGVGNEQDYGMRIYDPRVGRFLSVDFLTESYPFYSPYAFSGNNPIKFVDLNGLEEHNPVPESYINPKLSIDMTNAPGTRTNSAGYVRNSQWFWRQELKEHPEMFSPENIQTIKAGRSPIIDEQWVKYNPSVASFVDETLVHHHIGQENMATPLPESVHKSWFKALHEVNPGGRTLSNSLKNLHEGFSWVMFFYDLTSDNPQALNMQFRAGEKLNTIYYDLDTKLYFSVTSRVSNRDKKGNITSTTVTYDEFLDYDYDQKSQKYIGVGKVATYEATKNEKTGDVKQQEVIIQ